MKVLVVREECHGFLFVAEDLKAVKCELLRTNWVQGGCTSYWNEAKGEWESLEEIYGENWQESFMGFDKDDLDAMGFYIQETEVVRE